MKKLLSKKIVACICLVLTVFAVSTSVLATDDISECWGSATHSRDVVIAKYRELGGDLDVENMAYVSISRFNTFSGYFIINKDVVTIKKVSFGNGYSGNYFFNSNNEKITSDVLEVFCSHPSTTHSWKIYDIVSNKSYLETDEFGCGNISYYDESGSVIVEGSYTLSNTEKKIVYEITYDEDNKKAQINASIKNASEGDTLYYSTLGFKLNGKLLNPHEIAQNDISYIPVSENGLIHLQALDAERQYYRYSWY